MTTRSIPALGEPSVPAAPQLHRRTLPNGLRVIAIRRPSVPMVELRLRILSPTASAEALAQATLWSETMLKGTARYDDQQLDQAIGALGAQLNHGSDRDKLLIGGSTIAENLAAYLDIFADVLTTASYPAKPVEDERGRLAEHLVMANSNAGMTAAKAISAKLFGTHPYATILPEPEQMAQVSADDVRDFHAARVRPDGGVLVLVGDLDPEPTLDLVEAALAGWIGAPRPIDVPAVSFEASPAITLVDRPGSVQSAIRFGMPALGREDGRYPAQRVANMLFGGYFSSRLVANLREDKGYTYTPRSSVDLGVEASTLTINADVSTEVTAAAVNEIRYELGRLASTLPGDAELEDARQYLIGAQLLSMSGQAGLAGQTANLEIAGLGLDWLAQHQRALETVTAADIRAVAEDYLTPAAARIAVVGDVARIEKELSTLGPLDTAPGPQADGEEKE